MANATLAEAVYAKNIIDKKETIDRNVVAVVAQTKDIMAKLVVLHGLVEDAQSKTDVLAIRQNLIDQLTAAVTV